MAEPNPFDQYDTLRMGGTTQALPATAPAPTPATNPFDQYDDQRMVSGKSAARSGGGIRLQQFPTGFNEAAADIAGAPVDAMTWALNRYGGKVNEIAKAAGASGDIFGRIEHPVGGSESIKSGLGLIGIDPR